MITPRRRAKSFVANRRILAFAFVPVLLTIFLFPRFSFSGYGFRYPRIRTSQLPGTSSRRQVGGKAIGLPAKRTVKLLVGSLIRLARCMMGCVCMHLVSVFCFGTVSLKVGLQTVFGFGSGGSG
ncbi:hypothetical protein DL98DRAFT_93860 [Cadophora sp. DSE1049]|nr:hypothetical protein DL98DRAFT_93860 [Cadophora sp. DSE1049]